MNMTTLENIDERIIFPDEVDDIKAKARKAAETEAIATNSIEEAPQEIALENKSNLTVPENFDERIVFPDEVDDIKKRLCNELK